MKFFFGNVATRLKLLGKRGYVLGQRGGVQAGAKSHKGVKAMGLIAGACVLVAAGNTATNASDARAVVGLKEKKRTLAISDEASLLAEKVSLVDLNKRYKLVGDSGEEISGAFQDSKALRESMLGTGAYGKVVRAKDQTGRMVAVKIINRKRMAWNSLAVEIEALRRSRQHPYVNELLEVVYCEELDSYFLVSEFCNGGELFDRLIMNGPYKENVAKELVLRICSALSHIHACGYAHMDLKPENLLFKTASKDGLDIRLIDFGMTKRLDNFHDNGVTTLSKGIGTTPYLSPEVLVHLDEGNLDLRRKGKSVGKPKYFDLTSDPRACDMWALGVITYILLLGCHPFDRNGNATDQVIANRALRGSLGDEPSDDAKNPRFTYDVHKGRLRLSTEAKDLISRLLDPNPATRLRSDQVLEHPWIKASVTSEDSTSEAVQLDAEQDVVSLSILAASLAHKLVMDGVLERDARFIEKGKFEGRDAFLKMSYNIFASDQFAELVKHAGGSTPTIKTYDDYKQCIKDSHMVRCKTGKAVFESGDEVEGVYVIISGQVQVEYDSKDGSKPRIVATLLPGGMFGETAILDGRDRRNATVRCTKDTQMVFWSRGDVVRALVGTTDLSSGLEEHIHARQNRRARMLLETIDPSILTAKEYHSGDELYPEHNNSDELFILQHGVVDEFASTLDEFDFSLNRMFRMFSSKEDIFVQRCNSGSILGTEAVLGGKRVTSAICASDSRLIAVNTDDLKRLLTDEPSLHNNLLRLSRRHEERKLLAVRTNPASLDTNAGASKTFPSFLESVVSSYF
uniref:cGMP-dependent protein kinase n=1 Tax=Mucochytrium quahogii TaxID=96639 RepID=A0A7S2SI81_9STRA|mmetsp:Transcript_15658/g.27313  ORF Transcript_15658/g.27313 Transcript_15658/m.27313 type:complete len:798 (+) Transcript_15658:135-2528(+)